MTPTETSELQPQRECVIRSSALLGRRIVALSGGKDSTAMALRLAEVEPADYQYCITPTGRELPEMVKHWKRLECLLGAPLVRIPGPSLLDLIIKKRMLPNFRARYCTAMVKIEPFIKYAASVAPAVCYVGIRADEADNREGTNWNGIEGVKQNLPLARWGWGINRVREYLRERGVEVPERTDCDCCYHQRIGEWWRLWRDHKDRWQEIEALETWTGHTLRSEQRDSWPASLKGMRGQFEAGNIPKGAAQTEIPLAIAERSTMCAWCAR
jgi:3'-phosphoadenosine 5'-phosphosulfate sulfotransferase (PAPS reductase)/FAD synthetase